MAEKTIKDVVIYVLLGLALFLLVSNFDPTLANVYAIGLFLLFVYYAIDKDHSFPIEKQRNLGKSFLYAVIGYIVVIVSSTFFKNIHIFGITDTRSVLQIMAETQATLAFEKSLWITFFAFAILIPIIETGILGMILEFIKDNTKINFEKLNIALIAVFFIISTFFMYLHLSAKGVSNEAALMITFIFALVTCVIIFLERQTLGAMLLHIISNSVALIISFGKEFSISIIYGVLIILGITLLLKKVRISPTGLLGG